jgi:hypothetical protein
MISVTRYEPDQCVTSAKSRSKPKGLKNMAKISETEESRGLASFFVIFMTATVHVFQILWCLIAIRGVTNYILGTHNHLPNPIFEERSV